MTTFSLFTRSLVRRCATTENFVLRLQSNVTTTQMSSRRFMSTYFTVAHEYVKVDGTVGTVGITDFAQSQLGDIVYVDLPDVGDQYEKGDSFGSVESVKAASDVYMPVSGTIDEINDTISDDPGRVNKEAETDAWFIKISISNPDELNDLMNEEAYKEHCEKQH